MPFVLDTLTSWLKRLYAAEESSDKHATPMATGRSSASFSRDAGEPRFTTSHAEWNNNIVRLICPPVEIEAPNNETYVTTDDTLAVLAMKLFVVPALFTRA